MSVTAGADALTAAATGADPAVRHTSAAHADQPALETLGRTVDTGGAEAVRMTDTTHGITTADATDPPHALLPRIPSTSRRAVDLDPAVRQQKS